MKMIEVTAIDLMAEKTAYGAMLEASGVGYPAMQQGEEDDLEQPISPAPAAAPATCAPFATPESACFPAMICLDDVREFYPRQGGWRQGTRIVFKNGAARPVKETYDEIKAKFASFNN